ncbi:MAG: TIGR02206 family membrane protein [Thioalkalivibrio sp.]|nr:TIGR02206 family membrane protein [Thioalkalivibrio sp.]
MESQSFELLGSSHLTTLIIIAAVAIVLPLAVRRLAPHQAGPFAYLLASLLLGQEAVDLWRQVDAGNLSPAALLPLHLCTLAVYLTAWTLITRSYRTYEVAYFWGLGGTIQALLTPDLTARFPDPAYLLFFAGHGLVIIGVMHLTITFRLRPHAVSIPRVAAITAALAGIVFVINLWLDTNFLYLMAKPAQPSLLDWFGPWPWYLIGLVIVGLTSLFVWYLPFLFLDLWRQRRRRHADAA